VYIWFRGIVSFKKYIFFKKYKSHLVKIKNIYFYIKSKKTHYTSNPNTPNKESKGWIEVADSSKLHHVASIVYELNHASICFCVLKKLNFYFIFFFISN